MLKRSRLGQQWKWTRSGIFTGKIKEVDNENALDVLQSCFLFKKDEKKSEKKLK